MLTEQIIATKIRTIREAKNYSQFYVAYKLNISQNTFSKIELGYVKLTVARLIEIARILEISVPDLLNENLLLLQPELAVINQTTTINNN
ncbi:helix-turn-helix domain-containing protein [Mucilaginibacter flavus]|uniref:helix-turn-helix domain-containing protein n=1 Tax=Mucilaginibacter flavus TaxID=931504 RepID=UPI0025B4C73E|nr:helix-turn-helix transcriptional regulator [Mucilaginibacter flavus]MDN3582992.1 helix-turn-helix transcriptional regulator [Mucilaginibacter flavus]